MYSSLSILIFYVLISHPNIATLAYILISLHFVVFVRVLKIFITESIGINLISVYSLVLMMYELTIVLRGIYTIIATHPSILFNVITVTMDIALGIFFCIFTEGNKYLYIRNGADSSDPVKIYEG